MNVLEHLESFLGETDGGWKDPPGETWPFYVLGFSHGPIKDSLTLSTLGLSDFELECGAKRIRHELMFMTRQSFGSRNIPAILHDVGVEAIERKHPYLRGEVIGPRGKLFPDTELEALFASSPCYFPDEFANCTPDDGTVRIFVWLIPITRREADFIATSGWKAFEDRLLQADPDLLDMNRKSVV